VVGRVTFHLAENKADTQRPFAFLATFTDKLSRTGQPQHLPLARALQLYAGQKDSTALQALLEPVRLATFSLLRAYGCLKWRHDLQR
jgi:non-specific serine/threonine protein kinase